VVVHLICAGAFLVYHQEAVEQQMLSEELPAQQELEVQLMLLEVLGEVQVVMAAL
jgi:hypothetical protein